MVIGDVVTRAVGDAVAPVVLDVGWSQGRWPAGSLTGYRTPWCWGVDVHPLLLALGRARYGHRVHSRCDVAGRGFHHDRPRLALGHRTPS